MRLLRARVDSRKQASPLTKLEYKLLESVKKSPKTEKKICKRIGINMSIISPTITRLMLRGYIESTTKKRIFFRSSEYFSITLDGLATLEANAVYFHPLIRAISQLKDVIVPQIIKNEGRLWFVGLGLSLTACWLVKMMIRNEH